MKEGTEEKDTIRVVYCRGFKKLLNIKDCNSAQCRFHLGIQREDINQRDGKEFKVVGVHETVMCGLPRLEKILQVCEVK